MAKEITGPWLWKLSKRQNTNRIEKFTILTRFFTLDRRLCTMKLSSIKPYFEFKELSISEFIKSYKNILNELNVILEPGYLNSQNLMLYPIINELIIHFTINDDYIDEIFTHEFYK